MFSSPRQLIKYGIIALVIAALVVGGYFLITSGGGNNQANEEDTTQNNQGPPTPEPRELTNLQVISPHMGSDGRIRYYREADGRVFSLDPDTGQTTSITDTELAGLTKSVWGPQNNQVISVFRKKDGTRQVFHYSFTSRQATELSSNLYNIAFNSDGSRIAYQFKNEQGTNVLSVASPKNKNFQKLTDLEVDDPTIFWIQNKVAYTTTDSGNTPGSIASINPQTGERQTLQTGIFNLAALPSPTGSKMLFTEGEQGGGETITLNAHDLASREVVNLKLATLPQKCTWNSGETMVYCAVPQNIPSSAVLPDHWRTGDFTSNDEIWQIDLNRLEGRQLTGSLGRDIGWMHLTQDGLGLVFQDKTDKQLYRIELPQ